MLDKTACVVVLLICVPQVSAAQDAVRLAGTDLTIGQARATLATNSTISGEGTDLIEHVYAYRGQGRDLILANASADAGFLSLSLYDQKGTLLSAAYRPASQQALYVPALVPSGYLLVRAQPARPGNALKYSLQMVERDKASVSYLARGYVYRTVIPEPTYQSLLAVADQDQGPAARQCAAADLFRLIADIIGPPVLLERGETRAGDDTEQPMVVFLGLGGNSQIVQLRRNGADLESVAATTLGKAKDFWAVYIEDDNAQFETSIDVEFSKRASQSDFEGFNPLSAPVVAGNAGDAIPVRIGLRRFSVRQPPVTIQVAFTRQGPTYGLRQWHRVFYVFGWGTVNWALGLFVPGTEINVPYHSVVERDCELIACRPGENGLVVQDQLRRQVFATLILEWPEARSAFTDAIGWNKLLHPTSLILGLGLPSARDKAFYVGLSWPLAWNRLQGTIGGVFGRYEKIAEGYRVGQLVPLGTPREWLTDHEWDLRPMFGLAVDLLRR